MASWVELQNKPEVLYLGTRTYCKASCSSVYCPTASCLTTGVPGSAGMQLRGGRTKSLVQTGGPRLMFPVSCIPGTTSILLGVGEQVPGPGFPSGRPCTGHEGEGRAQEGQSQSDSG